MPEGHTVHRLATALWNLFGGQPVAVSSPQGPFAQGAALLNGWQVSETLAVGKQLFVRFQPASLPAPLSATDLSVMPDQDQEYWLRVHLGLYGSWVFSADTSQTYSEIIGAPRLRIGEKERSLTSESNATWMVPPPRGQVRLRLESKHAVADLSGPTVCEVITHLEVLQVRARIGPDPLLFRESNRRFITKAQASKRPIAALLMDQAVIGGVGNIFRAETLFRCRLNPYLMGKEISTEKYLQLWRDLKIIMRRGVELGNIVTTEKKYRKLSDHYVYQRSGKPCLVCNQAVSMELLNTRKLYWCANCQK